MESNNYALFGEIENSLIKAKAITLLMALAANDETLDCKDELILAQQVASSLIANALKAAEQMAKGNQS